MSRMKEWRDRYLKGDSEAVTNELHQLTIDQLIEELGKVGIKHWRSHGRPSALKKASKYIVRGETR